MAHQSLFKLFGTLQKVEEEEDGTIKVFGIASAPSRDAVGEIVSADAMKAALPDYSKFPALREMHQPSAAGKVLEAEVDEDGNTQICAQVVDPVAIVKVRTGVYAGFSIGGKVLKRDPKDRSIITSLKLIEISLVDSPCNPDAILSMWKAADMSEFKPESAAVIERAKTLAKAAGTQRFKDYLFEASQELIAEHLLEKGEIEEPGLSDALAGEAEPEAKEAAAAGDPSADPPAEEEAAGEEVKEAAASGDAPAAEEAGEADADAGQEGADSEAKEAAAEPDPAAALADAIGKAKDAIEAAAPAPEDPGPFADLGKAAEILKDLKLKIGADGEPIEKNLYSVSRFADLLQSFAYLQSSISCEAQRENDGSPIPEQLLAAINSLGDILVDLVREEVAELLVEISGPEVVEIIYCGNEVERGQAIIDLIKADGDLMSKAGERLAKAAPAAEEAPEGEEADELGKAQARIAELESQLEKANGALGDAAPAVEELTKGFNDTIEGLKGEIADLRKRFEDEPLPPKTAGPAAGRPISKGSDSTGNGGGGGDGAALSQAQIDEAWAAMSEAEKGQLLVKIALANPKAIALPRA